MAARSVILIDFDNIFGTLWDLDREAAERFASEPGDWLQVLANAHLIDEPRRWLVARCYFNPGGFVPAPGEPNGKRYFSRYRTSLVRAGFDVVDCPAVSRGGKNAADIRIVIDALGLLDHRTRFDEFVIASGDSDFTPLLQRLRAEDRRTTIVSPGYLATAYAAFADRIVDYDALQKLLAADTAPPTQGGTALSASPGEPIHDDDAARFQDIVRRRYEEASGPISLAALALETGRAIAGAKQSGWFGRGSFSAAVVGLDLPHARFSQHHVWDEERHQPPVASATEGGAVLPPAVLALVRAIDLPRIGREEWSKLFGVLSRYADGHDFSLTEATKWCRDALLVEGVQVARKAIGYVIRGAQLGGVRLDTSPPPTAHAISEAFLSSLLSRTAGLSVPMDEEAEAEVVRWFRGSSGTIG